MTVSNEARDAIRNAAPASSDEVLHLEISPQFQYDLFFAPTEADDVVLETSGLRIALDPSSLSRADGVHIAFVQNAGGAGFQITSPNDPPRVKQITVHQLVEMLADNAPLHLVDVRTQRERDIARLEKSRLLDATFERELQALPRDARIVFQCHHGGRSQMAAERFIAQGFTCVHNLAGGIDAWSQHIDAGVARY